MQSAANGMGVQVPPEFRDPLVAFSLTEPRK